MGIGPPSWECDVINANCYLFSEMLKGLNGVMLIEIIVRNTLMLQVIECKKQVGTGAPPTETNLKVAIFSRNVATFHCDSDNI